MKARTSVETLTHRCSYHQQSVPMDLYLGKPVSRQFWFSRLCRAHPGKADLCLRPVVLVRPCIVAERRLLLLLNGKTLMADKIRRLVCVDSLAGC